MTTSTTYICDVCSSEQSNNTQFWTFSLGLRPHGTHGLLAGHAQTFDACRTCAEKFGMLPYVSTSKPEEPPSIADLLREVMDRLQDE